MAEQISFPRPATVAVMVLLVLAPLALAVWPHYPGNFLPFFGFIAAGIGLLGVALFLRPSVYIVTLSTFLTLGFLVKAIAHLMFDAELIEPIGRFDGSGASWDTTLNFATAGLGGALAASAVSALFPAKAIPISLISKPGGRQILTCLFGAALLAAIAIYGLNFVFNFNRIGYPPGLVLPAPLQIILSFMISWGLLLGMMSLAYWLVVLRVLPRLTVVYVAILLGFLASVTMGSRIQFLLYFFAALGALAHHWPIFRSWRQLAITAFAAGALFVGSLATVSIERAVAFLGAPETTTATTPQGESRAIERLAEPETASPGPENVQETSPLDDHRLGVILLELRRLIVMRWVGLEAVMTASAVHDELGQDLFVDILEEDPSVGVNSIYQRLSGGKYDGTEYFTFLTLPGVIGIASLSGHHLVIFIFVFLVALGGHLIELTALHVTSNAATAAVAGVGLAYLTVQMPFPWTVLVIAIQFVIAVLGLGLFWLFFRRAAGVGTNPDASAL